MGTQECPYITKESTEVTDPEGPKLATIIFYIKKEPGTEMIDQKFKYKPFWLTRWPPWRFKCVFTSKK